LWFEKEAMEATDFYFSVFGEAQMIHKNDFVSTFEIKGSKMMAINGGPHYKKTPAVSYFVYCGGDTEIERIYKLLIDGGKILMPLGNYAWSGKYAFVEDKFGTAWQLDIDDVNNSQKIVPCLLFVNEKNIHAGEAMDYYTQLVSKSTILFKSYYGPGQGMPEDVVLFGQFKLHNVIFNAMSSTINHDYDFTPGNSVVIECGTQDEIDYYWEKLGEGGQYSRCGWLTDKYGLSWQIIPDFLGEATSDPKTATGVIQAFMGMTKLEIEPLKAAMEMSDK
jgi:predicted 3-demethylubiquinone-9 3-methyltransferase (glyoxalase superfamily)